MAFYHPIYNESYITNVILTYSSNSVNLPAKFFKNDGLSFLGDEVCAIIFPRVLKIRSVVCYKQKEKVMNDTNHTQDESAQKAFEEYFEKASRNDAEAQFKLGNCYRLGRGVAQNEK